MKVLTVGLIRHRKKVDFRSLDRKDPVSSSPSPCVTSNGSFFFVIMKVTGHLSYLVKMKEVYKPTTGCTKDRQANISKFLTDRNDAKMNKKLNCETEMLYCPKEYLQLKLKL